MASSDLTSRKRQPLEKIDESTARKRFDHNRLAVVKSAPATRIFWTQAEALEFIAERQNDEKNRTTGEILYLFCFDTSPDGERRYQVADIDVFVHEYYRLPADQRHTYEIIVDKKPSKLYFDLQFDLAANPTMDGSQLTKNFIQFVLNFMRQRSDDLNYSIDDVLVLDSTSATTFRRHVIFQLKDPFLDSAAVRRFVNLIFEDLHGCLINHHCPAMPALTSPFPTQQSQHYADALGFARQLLVTLEPYLTRFNQCTCTDAYSQLRYSEMIELIVKHKDQGGLTWLCNMGVYSKNHAFRLFRSSRFGQQERFIVAPENRWRASRRHAHPTSTEPSDTERQLFMASLVYFHGPIRRFIHVDDETVPSEPSIHSQTHPSFYVINDLRKITLDYPELVQFMMNVAQEPATTSGTASRSSRIYKAKHTQNEFRWEISFMYTGAYKYCERIQRHHKQNNIYFVVDMRKGTYRQHCHDAHCRTFQGTERLLPSNVTPWLTIINEEWDGTAQNLTPRSMQETL